MGFQRAFLFLVLMCATLMVHGQPEEVRDPYKRFLEKHVRGNMTIKNCQNVMINLPRKGGSCKQTNTFILANPGQVKPICVSGGTSKGGNLVQSNNPFTVVICNLTGGINHPNCIYKGSSSTVKVIIACDRGWPVHYGGDIIVPTGRK